MTEEKSDAARLAWAMVAETAQRASREARHIARAIQRGASHDGQLMVPKGTNAHLWKYRGLAALLSELDRQATAASRLAG
jgi:hypothetical protein